MGEGEEREGRDGGGHRQGMDEGEEGGRGEGGRKGGGAEEAVGRRRRERGTAGLSRTVYYDVAMLYKTIL